MQDFLSKDEYKHLLEMLYIADWVMNSHHESHYLNLDYKELIQKIFANAYNSKVTEDIMYDKDLNAYYPTPGFEEFVHKRFIDDYEHEVFWDELVDRMALQELNNQTGNTENNEASEANKNERMLKLQSISEKYAQILEKHGIDCVQICEPNKKP